MPGTGHRAGATRLSAGDVLHRSVGSGACGGARRRRSNAVPAGFSRYMFELATPAATGPGLRDVVVLQPAARAHRLSDVPQQLAAHGARGRGADAAPRCAPREGCIHLAEPVWQGPVRASYPQNRQVDGLPDALPAAPRVPDAAYDPDTGNGDRWMCPRRRRSVLPVGARWSAAPVRPLADHLLSRTIDPLDWLHADAVMAPMRVTRGPALGSRDATAARASAREGSDGPPQYLPPSVRLRRTGR
jgi:hypothetical protein